MRLVFVSAFFTMITAPLAAAETPWQEVAPGVSLRLVSSGQVKADGTTMLGLEIDMPQTTKTYWRVPGETGLPAQLDFSASQGVGGHRIVWPYPLREETDTYLDYVYRGPTLLPIELATSSATPDIALSVVMGVCSDICIPVRASFELPSASGADPANGLRIKQAAAMAPIPWDGDPGAIGTVRFLPQQNMLSVQLADPSIDPASLIAATDDPDLLFGAPQKSPEPDLVLIPLLGKTHGIDLESQSVQLTFMTEMGAYEVTRTAEGAGI